MKTLLLIRHAKSDWGNASLPDVERPLNERGKKDAPAMARRLLASQPPPALIICSAAKRAYQTARLMAAEWDYPKESIRKEEKLYEAGLADYYGIIREVDDQYTSLALFGHNPTIGMFANVLTSAQVNHFPTSCIAVFRIYTDRWQSFTESEKELLLLDYPRRVQ